MRFVMPRSRPVRFRAQTWRGEARSISAGAWWISALAAFLIGWAAVNVADGGGFVLLVSDALHGEEEAVSAITRLFGALVLWLSVTKESGQRFGWVAAGLIVLGLGHLAFGYAEPLIEGRPTDFEEALYERLFTSVCACALLVVGLVPRTAPRLTFRTAVISFFAAATLYILFFEVFEAAEWLPPLAIVDAPSLADEAGSPFGWLTGWHWIIAALPLALVLAAAAGALRQNRLGVVPDWLLAAVVVLAGSLLHEYFWPTNYASEFVTSADVLRLAFAAVVAVGGIFELRRIATERASLLDTEKERVRRLNELSAMKADFSEIVAHELGGPLASIRVCNEMVSAKGGERRVREYATSTIRSEVEALNNLVSDVRAAAAVERDDLPVEPRPTPLSGILADAESYARLLPGDHPVTTSVNGVETSERVVADRGRVGQVLKNLLSNAAKYTPEGTPVDIRAFQKGERIRVEIADRGPGLRDGDASRVFGKYERGSGGGEVSGAGLGLYLSRRIVRNHGSDLTVDSEPGEGAAFGFDLEVER